MQNSLEAGAEVGLTPEVIDAEMAKREERKVAAQLTRIRRQTWGFRVLTGFGITLTAAFALSAWNSSTLDDDTRQIEAHAAHVREAVARQTNTREQMEGQPPSSTRDAELSGARNRVSIAIRRYNAAVATYNGHSDRWMMFRSYRTHPARYPFAQEATR